MKDQVQDPSRLPGPEWAGETPSAPPLILEGPSPTASPLLPHPHLPPRPQGPRQPRVGPQRVEDLAQEPSRLPRADWAGDILGTLSPYPPSPPRVPSDMGNPSLSQPPLGAPVPYSLHFSSSLTSPHVLPSLSGVPPISLGAEVPHQQPAGALLVGRQELCVLPCSHLDSASLFLYLFVFDLLIFH